MIVSFDFDSTLQTMMKRPNKEFVEKFKEHIIAGDTIHIVTSRHPIEGSTKEIYKFLWENELIINNQTEGVHIPDIHYTYGESKISILIELGVERHYDDCPSELSMLPPHIEGVDAWNKQAEDDFNQHFYS